MIVLQNIIFYYIDINHSQKTHVLKQIDDAVSKGAKILFGNPNDDVGNNETMNGAIGKENGQIEKVGHVVGIQVDRQNFSEG